MAHLPFGASVVPDFGDAKNSRSDHQKRAPWTGSPRSCQDRRRKCRRGGPRSHGHARPDPAPGAAGSRPGCRGGPNRPAASARAQCPTVRQECHGPSSPSVRRQNDADHSRGAGTKVRPRCRSLVRKAPPAARPASHLWWRGRSLVQNVRAVFTGHGEIKPVGGADLVLDRHRDRRGSASGTAWRSHAPGRCVRRRRNTRHPISRPRRP